jgi:hypothetical protein
MKGFRFFVTAVAVLVLVSVGWDALCAGLPKLPSGPPGPGRFGASYAHLKYSPEWDKPWRVGDHPDVVVRFDDGGHRFVFWRGTSFIPCWVTDTGVWYTNEFVERRGHHSPNTEGCVEPMSDKQCRFSHVRIIESNDARVVVHWRYAPIDVRYEHPFTDPLTGWSDWVDEYYTIYPNAVGVRKITAQTSRPDLWMEFQEAIVVNQPGTLPDDNIEYGAVSLCNMAGESKTYVWTEDGGPDFDGPENCNIMKINLKGSLQTFAFAPPPEVEGRMITPYEGHGRRSHFNWWDHWPVSQVASDGRGATSAERPSHSSLCHIALHEPETWKPYAISDTMITKIMVHGMTDKPVEGLVPLAKSWLQPAPISVSLGYLSATYDPTQLAYVITRTGTAAGVAGDGEVHNVPFASELTLELAASEESPAINPAFVIKGWGERDAELTLNGNKVERGKNLRLGHSYGLEGTDLIVWIKTESTRPIKLTLSPVGG